MELIKILPILSVSILFIFQLGVLGLSLLTRSHFRFRRGYSLWMLSITFSCIGYLFSSIEIFNGQVSNLTFLGTCAAFCFSLSQVLLLLTLKNIDGERNSIKLIYFLLFLTSGYIFLFEYGRIFEDFIFRGILTSIFFTTLAALELHILWRLKHNQKKVWSRQLYFPAIAILSNLLISFVRIIFLLNTDGQFLIIETAISIIIFSIAQAFMTLTFIGISYYWVEEIGISNRKLAFESKELKTLLAAKEQTLNQLLLSQKSTMLGAYAHLVAHEVNQPLATLQINADFLKELLLPRSELVKEHRLIDSMIVEILRAASVIQSIKLLLTQDKNGPSFFSLDELAREVTQTQRNKMLENNIELNLSLNTPTFIFADRNELQLVLMNLLENAIFAMAKTLKNASNEANFQSQITLMTYFDGDNAVLKVIDSGPGVDSQYRNNLFELHNTSKAGGAGMGLWLSSFIAKRHNGTLTYDDTYLEGASFSLIFPRLHKQIET